MEVRLDNRKPVGEVKVIQSKSFAHRILLAAALSKMTSGMETQVILDRVSEDMEATRRVIEAIENGEPILDCGESGTTLRFMVPVCGALQGKKAGLGKEGQAPKIRFTGHGRLMKRPMQPLFDAMKPHGVGTAYEGENGEILVLTGGLTAGEYSIAANVSSQYISGLLFALPLLEGDSLLNLTGKVESRPYIDITLDVLRRFGIRIEEEVPSDSSVTCRFRIPGGQSYRGPERMEVEGDWSNAAFWLVMGALEGPVTVSGLNLESVQGDKAICKVLRDFGACLTENPQEGSVTCSCPDGKTLHGIEIDVADIPDAVPVLSIAAASAEGDTRIYNAGRLRMKESDRLQTVTEMLQALGCPVEEGEDFLIIHGQGCSGGTEPAESRKLSGGSVDGAGDHRIVMSAAAAASICRTPVVITGAEAVNKSYPGFFEEREKLWEAHTEKH